MIAPEMPMNDHPELTQHEFLTVRELAELLRIKERKVYDLAASGDVPVSRATGKLLFPRREIEAWIANASSGGATKGSGPRPAICLGSHDPLLEWAIRQSRCGLASFFEGSLDGLNRFCADEGVMAGLHLHDEASGEWNLPHVANRCSGENAVLVSWARRSRGLVLRPDLDGDVTGLFDLAGRIFIPRQKDTGTQRLFEALAADAGLSLQDLRVTDTAPSETDSVIAVAEGLADATFGLEALARQYNLPFVPVIEERFDLLVDRRSWFEPQMQRLLAFCRSDSFQSHAGHMAGYRLEDLGAVLWNA
ncbi:Excisionase/Xis, DNA-binding protein [Roseobacter sp. AzwK-3b]|nr:Excisionase/Xis, DNA-binding protein [Roseobacter sp. AzwK-3b]